MDAFGLIKPDIWNRGEENEELFFLFFSSFFYLKYVRVSVKRLESLGKYSIDCELFG